MRNKYYAIYSVLYNKTSPKRAGLFVRAHPAAGERFYFSVCFAAMRTITLSITDLLILSRPFMIKI